jgi:hypothetical protein
MAILLIFPNSTYSLMDSGGRSDEIAEMGIRIRQRLGGDEEK